MQDGAWSRRQALAWIHIARPERQIAFHQNAQNTQSERQVASNIASNRKVHRSEWLAVASNICCTAHDCRARPECLLYVGHAKLVLCESSGRDVIQNARGQNLILGYAVPLVISCSSECCTAPSAAAPSLSQYYCYTEASSRLPSDRWRTSRPLEHWPSSV